MTETTATNTTSTTSYSNYCPQRLPCGYCVLLSRPCPMQCNTNITPTWDPNWYKIYCNANTNAPNAYYIDENHNYHVSPLTEEKNG